MRVNILLALLDLMNLPIWRSRNGFGVTLNWPHPEYVRQVRRIQLLFKYLLPKTYVTEGPCFTAGGAYVMYAWPQDDPQLRAAMAKKARLDS